MTQKIYLLVHDYGGLEGLAYNSHISDLSFTIQTAHELVLEIKTLSDGQKSHYDLLNDESEKHFKHIVNLLFPNCAVDVGITRDIFEYYCQWQIVPKDKLPIPENELGVLIFDFPHYPVFGSSLISLLDYIDSKDREYYDIFYKFDRIITEIDKRIKMHLGFEKALSDMKPQPQFFEQLTKSLKELQK